MSTEKDDMILSTAQQIGDEMHIDLWYPRNETSPVKYLAIGLMDIRAADDIRVSYDFDRDGWKIEQASTFEWAGDDEVCDPDWQEVAFVQAWGREKTPDADSQQNVQAMASADDKSPTEGSDFMIPENDQETTEGGLSIRDLLAVLEPVIDWYQSDEEDPRAPLDILRDMVTDLQSDRKAALVASSAATDALALCHQIERCGCSPELTEASIMASRLRAKLSSANASDQATLARHAANTQPIESP